MSGPCPTEIPAAPTRLCESCFHTRPLAEFRRRKQGSDHRVRQCRQCHNEFERYRRAAVRARLSKRKMARDLSRAGAAQRLLRSMARQGGRAARPAEASRTRLSGEPRH